MPTPDLSSTPWRKSSRSSPTSVNCVEVGRLPDRVLVRDSLDPDGPILSCSPDNWVAFLDQIRSGRFKIR
jgi:hypothetical protein